MTWPEAEISIDAALVRRLVHAQHPDLAGSPLREVASGFDNSIWRLGTSLIVRLPRRAVAAQLLANEIRWLPELSPRLPLPTPTPLRIGHADEDYPWPWSIARWIDGTPGNLVPFDEDGACAVALGEFLRVLHPAAPSEAPFNDFRSGPLAGHALAYSQRLADVPGAIDASAVAEVLQRAQEAPPWEGRPQWIHGDLHPANTIFHEGRLVGIIDFGDMCAGDPATDLAGAFLSLPYRALPAFFDAYGGASEATTTRALGWAAHFGLMFTMLGHCDEPTYAPIGARALANTVRYSQRGGASSRAGFN